VFTIQFIIHIGYLELDENTSVIQRSIVFSVKLLT